MLEGLGLLAPLLILGVVVITNIFKILREYERGVVFTLGRVGRKAAGPGLVLLIPIIQQMRKVDMRTLVLDVPSLPSLRRIPLRDPWRGTRAHVGELLESCPDAATLVARLASS